MQLECIFNKALVLLKNTSGSESADINVVLLTTHFIIKSSLGGKTHTSTNNTWLLFSYGTHGTRHNSLLPYTHSLYLFSFSFTLFPFTSGINAAVLMRNQGASPRHGHLWYH